MKPGTLQTNLADEEQPIKIGLTGSELLAMARADFWCFIELTFPVLHPGQQLDYAPYLELLATVLMTHSTKRYRRMVFNLPPRHMKSLIISIMYPAWRLGRDPGAKFICISYGDDLAHEHSSLTRKLMQSRVYRQIFPGTILDKKAVDHIKTTASGQRYATSIGSDITGFGADEIIIDDPIQPHDAGSEKRKEEIRSWVQSSVLTRLNNPKEGKLLLVMHRLAPDDLSGTFEPDADLVIKLPLVATEPEKFSRDNRMLLKREVGDILNPNRMSREDVQALQRSMARHVFDSQYQQAPTIGGSGMLSISRFRRFDLASPPRFELLIHSWDVGATINGNASVCTKWGLVRTGERHDELYLVDVIRIKQELPEVRAAIRSENRRDKPALIILDERGVGLGLYQELRREGYRNITGSVCPEPLEREGASGSRPNLSKIERFGYATLLIDDGRVLIPQAAAWLEAFLYEVASFPNIPDKDQVDSMTQVLAYMERAVQMARLNKDRLGR